MEALRQFADGVIRLTAEADLLKRDRERIDVQVTDLQKRRHELDHDLAQIELQSLDLAKNYASRAQQPTAPTPTDHTPPPSMTANKQPSLEIDDDHTTATPQSHPDHTPTTVTVPTDIDPIHDNFPTVVFLDGAWSEIWCGRCGTNCLKHPRGQFFAGTKGLYKHWIRAHKDEVTKTIECCIGAAGCRLVSATDVERMRAGAPPTEVAITLRLADDSVQRKAAAQAAKSSKIPTPNGSPEPWRATSDTATNGKPSLKRKELAEDAAGRGLHGDGSTGKMTTYEQFQKVEAEAKVGGGPEVKRRRTSVERPNFTNRSPEEDEELQDPSWSAEG
ncbi:hypothetical protein LTR56_015138 [Elasticomyces elasticus]|nr:hypothetical protein LTR56_015138 [Elasticomyces elasticus]KAK3651980.1 hypothetical protein LTR22_011910 [Elasticomyces elasticus]KAK4919067.1 hypothetical protein LTR49_013238 [Elasticomyces elasticus]KAK5765701.1 hypothetical protein LTS12_004207 [Elasticomyces elasticus]